MISARFFQWCKLVSCAVLAVLLGGCAGGPPERRGRAPASSGMKVVVVSFGKSPYAQARSRDVEAFLESRVTKDISIEYVTGDADALADNVDSEQRAIEVGRAQDAGVVVWAKRVDEGSPELQMTTLATTSSPTITVSVPVEVAEVGPGGSPGNGEDFEEPSSEVDGAGDPNDAVEPLRGIVVPPNLGPLPAGPGAWDPKKQPVELYIGGEIHKKIAKFYADQHEGNRVFTNYDSIAVIAKFKEVPLPKGFSAEKAGLQPDIFNVTKGHLYEIKSSSTAEIMKGLAKLAVYRTALREAGIQATLGPAGEPGTSGMVSAPKGYAYFTVVLDGLIVYRYTKSRPEPELNPLFVLRFAHEVLQNLEKSDQPAPYTPPVRTPVPIMAPAPPPGPVPLVAPAPTTAYGPLGNMIVPASMPFLRKKPLLIIRDDMTELKAKISDITGLTGTALIIYLIISEGSRVLFPPRNLVPVP